MFDPYFHTNFFDNNSAFLPQPTIRKFTKGVTLILKAKHSPIQKKTYLSI